MRRMCAGFGFITRLIRKIFEIVFKDMKTSSITKSSGCGPSPSGCLLHGRLRSFPPDVQLTRSRQGTEDASAFTLQLVTQLIMISIDRMSV